MVVPEGTRIMMMTKEAFTNMLLKEASHSFDNYGLVSREVLGLGAEGIAKEVKLVHHKCLESRLD